MELGLYGKSAAVAAASSGLGLAIAQSLAAEGANVSICARSPDRLESARAAVDSAGQGLTHGRQVDVRNPADVRQWIDDTAAAFGGLHILVANAGGPRIGTATDVSLTEYEDALQLNLLSSIAMCHAAAKYLIDAGWGRILFVTSVTVREPDPNVALSNTARAGVVGYAKSLVHDMGPRGVTVNVLAPGPIRTSRMQEVHGNSESIARLAQERLPLRRVGEPDEFAAVATFLASEASAFVTGAVVPVDGGMSRMLL